MEISNANPIQWWLIDQASFNNKIEVGIEHKNYCQPFNSEDPIRDQFRDAVDLTFRMAIYNTDDEEVDSIDYVEIQDGIYELLFVPDDYSITNEEVYLKRFQVEAFSNPDFADGLDDWENIVSATGAAWGVPFTKASTNLTWTLVAGTKETYHLRHDFPQTTPTARTVNYAIEVTDATFGGLVGDSNFYARYRKAGVAVGVAQLIRNIPPVDFGSLITDSFVTAESDFDEIEFYFTGAVSTGAAEGDINYDVELFEVDGLLEAPVAYTDHINIKVNHPKTRLFSYSNDIEYAGLDYTDNQNFHIRVKSKFYDIEEVEENESEDFSDGSTEKISSSTKEGKLLETYDMPPYMHRKIRRVLQHNSIYIENQAWVKEGSYETTKIHEKYAFFDGKTLLTLKNEGFVTNVY